MRIAHTMAYFQPILGYQEYYLAKKQEEMGHEVCVITSDRYYPYPNFKKTVGGILKGRFVGSGVFYEEGILVVRLPSFFEYADQILLDGISKSLSDFKPDVVHIHGVFSHPMLVSLLLKKRLNYKVIVDCHTDYSLQSKSYLRRLAFKLLSKNPVCRNVLKKANGYIAVSESSRIWLSNEWGIGYREIEFIPLGADRKMFSQDPCKRKFIRSKLGINEDEVLIVYAGKLIPSKEIEVLLVSAAPLIHTYGNVRILLIGSGSKQYTNELEKIIQRYDIQAQVFLHNFVHKTKLPDYYNAADIGVWPGQDSITIVEAMATGLPVILPRSDRNIHYLEYNNGFNFERGNPNELQGFLEKLVLNPDLRREMALKSSKLVEEKLNWDVITKQTLVYYNSCRELT